MNKEQILQLLQDSSDQDPTSDSYEQRIIRDNDFEKIAELIGDAIEIKTLEWILELDCHPEYIKEAARDRIKEIKNPEPIHQVFKQILDSFCKPHK